MDFSIIFWAILPKYLFFRHYLLLGKMEPCLILTYKPHWKNSQLKWRKLNRIHLLHLAGEYVGTGTPFLSRLLFISPTTFFRENKWWSTHLCVTVQSSQEFEIETPNKFTSQRINDRNISKWLLSWIFQSWLKKRVVRILYTYWILSLSKTLCVVHFDLVAGLSVFFYTDDL